MIHYIPTNDIRSSFRLIEKDFLNEDKKSIGVFVSNVNWETYAGLCKEFFEDYQIRRNRNQLLIVKGNNILTFHKFNRNMRGYRATDIYIDGIISIQDAYEIIIPMERQLYKKEKI